MTQLAGGVAGKLPWGAVGEVGSQLVGGLVGGGRLGGMAVPRAGEGSRTLNLSDCGSLYTQGVIEDAILGVRPVAVATVPDATAEFNQGDSTCQSIATLS
jgi:hypothetical protein